MQRSDDSLHRIIGLCASRTAGILADKTQCIWKRDDFVPGNPCSSNPPASKRLSRKAARRNTSAGLAKSIAFSRPFLKVFPDATAPPSASLWTLRLVESASREPICLSLAEKSLICLVYPKRVQTCGRLWIQEGYAKTRFSCL